MPKKKFLFLEVMNLKANLLWILRGMTRSGQII